VFYWIYTRWKCVESDRCRRLYVYWLSMGIQMSILVGEL